MKNASTLQNHKLWGSLFSFPVDNREDFYLFIDCAGLIHRINSMSLLNLSNKVEPFKIAYSDDNYIARITITKKSKSETAVGLGTITAALTKAGFHYQLSAKKLDDAYWDYLHSGNLDFKFNLFSDELLELMPHVLVVISPDEMKAGLSVHLTKDKLSLLTPPLVHRILKNNRVHAGIDQEVINDIIKTVHEGTLSIESVPVALGIPELRGEDGSIELSTKFDREIEIEQKSKGEVKKVLPAKATGYTIRPDEVLITVYPAQKGVEGKKVTGETIWSETNTKTVRTPSVTISRGVEEKIYPHKIEYRSTVCGRAFFINNSIIDVEIAIDGTFSLEIGKDGLSCELFLKAPQGGRNISFKEIQEEIERRKITAPTDPELIKKTVDALNEKGNAATAKINIAEGIPPVHGMDEKIKWNINVEKAYFPAVDSQGNVDYHQGSSLPIIRKDENAGTLFPATKGEKNGMDIYGKEIPAQDGKTFGMELANLFEFIEGFEEERSCQYLKAKISGLFQIKGNNVQVLPVFVTKKVDYSTGNINFDGNVIIKDTVADGFHVRATKEIIINGNIGACRIESNENVIIKGGINGRMKGLVKSGKNVICKYAENCTVYAREKIVLEKHALISRLVSNGDILVGKGGKGGKIIGCHVYAENNIAANYVGAETSTDSLLWSGINKLIWDKREKASDDLGAIAAKLMDKKLVRETDLSPAELEQHYGEVRALEKERDEIQKRIESYNEVVYPFENAHITVLNDIQGHTMIKIGEFEFPLVSSKSRIRLKVDHKRIVAEDLRKNKT